MENFSCAYELLREFKAEAYLHGRGILPQVGPFVSGLGKRAVLVRDLFSGAEPFVQTIKDSFDRAGISLIREIDGAKPNCPLQDLQKIADELKILNPDIVVSFGGGSTIDAAKAAEILRTVGGEINAYFGSGLVSRAIEASGKRLRPHAAIQSASSSSAHLTKYSNITNLETGQKKLIVDDAIVPVRSVFDYEVTFGAPFSLTIDGALDGVAHSLEVLYGAIGKPYYSQMEKVAREGIGLVIEYLPRVLKNPSDAVGREALGLATDLGGYAIMLGGTNGGHLTSFSLVDILSHGRACAIMNPYYTVFFAPAIQEPLRLVGELFQKFGYIKADVGKLTGRRLGEAVAEAMIAFQKEVGMPTSLQEVPGFSDEHIERALAAAKNPQLKMKLENMPIPLSVNQVDEIMGLVLQAAKTGKLNIVKNTQ